MKKLFYFYCLVSFAFAYFSFTQYPSIAWINIILLPLAFIGIYDCLQKNHTLMRNYPLAGRGRYIMEELRPKIYQYFIESDTDGTPISRIFRSVVYQRAKQQLSTTPFGTQLNVYEAGYEWINHSITPLPLGTIRPENLRVKVGSKDCLQPYDLSLFNISAMSFGALSSNAIESLNKGAHCGDFAHNTGEGGLSPYHLKHGGDLIWQIGTGYFGCRTKDGRFCEQSFAKKSKISSVKMIEIKLSQGAKPGHGGILPAAKNTPEIAKARAIDPHTTVSSPSSHIEFSDFNGLAQFIKKLRTLSEGKPIGIKLCMGDPTEFEELCQVFADTKIYPDFITIDGGEGGTGAAPIEFSNSIGMALKDGIVIADNVLRKLHIREEIKIIAAGKILTGFDIVRIIALGADSSYSARGMMLALGCIQALICNTNKCPTGVATQDPNLANGLVVESKYKRISNYHHNTLDAVSEILCAAGINSPTSLNRRHIWRRLSQTKISPYSDLYPYPQQSHLNQFKTIS